MRNKSFIVNILWKYQQNESLSAKEEDELSRWLKADERNQLFFDELSDSEKWNKGLDEMRNKDSQAAVWTRIENALQRNGSRKTEKTISWKKYAVAAIISAFIFGIYIEIKSRRVPTGDETTVSLFANDVQPSVSHATLTLASGRIVLLDTLGHGHLNSTSVWKTDSNSLALLAEGSDALPKSINTLTTAAGTQYRLVLPDSSTVWLNAGSRLQFPSGFGGPERKVILSGEGYFEVSKNREKPFVVQSGNATITVLGTHFNVRNYENETAQRTTLLEGKVKVQAGKDSMFLMPGRQVFLPRQGNMQVVAGDTRQALAWRENLFWFQSASFEEIMGELKRWYPVQVHQTGYIAQRFTGILPKNRPLVEVLKILEMPGYVAFRLRGNDLEVMARQPQ